MTGKELSGATAGAPSPSVDVLKERVLDKAIRLHLESGGKPSEPAWKAFRKAAEDLWQADMR